MAKTNFKADAIAIINNLKHVDDPAVSILAENAKMFMDDDPRFAFIWATRARAMDDNYDYIPLMRA